MKEIFNMSILIYIHIFFFYGYSTHTVKYERTKKEQEHFRISQKIASKQRQSFSKHIFHCTWTRRFSKNSLCSFNTNVNTLYWGEIKRKKKKIRIHANSRKDAIDKKKSKKYAIEHATDKEKTVLRSYFSFINFQFWSENL